MRTLVVILSKPSVQESMALLIKDPYHEVDFERVETWLHSATHSDVFRDSNDILCNRHKVETLIDVIDNGDTPTVHFIYSDTEWEDFIPKLVKAFVDNEPHYRNSCTVRAAAALLSRANPTLSIYSGSMRGIAYVEEE